MPNSLRLAFELISVAMFVGLSSAAMCVKEPEYTPEQLINSAEGQLRYPGSVYTAPTTDTASVLNDANSVRFAFGTDDDHAAVEQWYDDQLTAAGWRKTRGPYSNGNNSWDVNWDKGNREFSLECQQPVNPRSGLAQFSTACNVGLFAGPPATTTPASSAAPSP
jgi:hypothetical protein